MKIVQVNLGNFGSTGGIAAGINEVAAAEGLETYFAYPWNNNNNNHSCKPNDIIIGSELGRRASIKMGRITGFNGCFSVFATFNFLRRLDKIKPDIIHLHNLHNCYINLPMLFRYIKRNNVRIVWTLHDCWAFTGQCPYFSLVGCEKWKTGCYDCPQIGRYPAADKDRTKTMWKLKRKWFTGVKNMTIVTPSKWLADLVKESYLSEYNVRVINNGIDLNVFHPIQSDIRDRLGIGGDRHIILGVAFDWEARKGLDVFIDLAKQLDDDYKIVLVGTDDRIDQELPENIISIHRTSNQNELAELYSMADLFFNPTREENFPTVNIEALACGTPVLTFNTGGSPEIIDDHSGEVVSSGEVKETLDRIIEIRRTGKFSRSDCVRRAGELERKLKFREYVNLYREVCGGVERNA